jgi:hypothetical protein
VPAAGLTRQLLVAIAGLAMALALAPAAAGLTPPTPIPEGPEADTVPSFIGGTVVPSRARGAHVPRHPYMAANGRSNLHDDAYQTDTYVGPGPRGRNTERLSTFMGGECATATFDRLGRIVTVCVGADGPRLAMFDPHTLDLLTAFPLPPRIPSPASGGNPFTDFSGGGYFYLDNEDRVVIPTATRHIWVIGETDDTSGPLFQLLQDYDVSGAVPAGDGIISAMPDWAGHIWYVSGGGVVGIVDPSGALRAVSRGERIGNSFAVDETGGVYIVSDVAMYRFDYYAGWPVVSWREPYANIGIKKPGQTEAGSGTTPTLLGREFVAITDNADPMNVVVYRRAAQVTGSRVVCTQPVFSVGASATDQSLIGADRSMVVENNYGYTGPTSVMNGVTTTPGFERVDINQDQSGCHTVWRNTAESAPSVVPKLSLENGIVYTYTKPQDLANATDSWYFTALDFRNGRTVYKRLAGTGLGFNNNFAPVSLARDGTAYVGALGGLVMLRDP